MDRNEFFREATVRICANLEIEEGLFSLLQYLHNSMPATHMFLERYEVSLDSTRTIALITLEEGKQADLLTPLTEQAQKWAEGYLSPDDQKVFLYTDPWSRPYASEMMRFHNVSLNSIILLPLETGGRIAGSLIIGSETDEPFTRHFPYDLPGNSAGLLTPNIPPPSGEFKLRNAPWHDNRC